MKQDILLIPGKRILTCIFVMAMMISGCRKEKMPEPSNLDENYFVIKDNPNDAVDHAIYQFYESTGIASFYNDTIHKKQTGDTAGVPRYAYIKLSLGYSLLGRTNILFRPLSSKTAVPALLDLFQNDLLSRLPDDRQIPSILFVDSFWNEYPIIQIPAVAGWSAWHGFNTVAIAVKDVEAMTDDEKKIYVSSVLAGLAEKRINRIAADQLQRDFFSISRVPGNALIQYDIYTGLPFVFFLMPDMIPLPEDLGFIRYIDVNYLNIPDPLYYITAPREADDLRAYLTAAFYYSTDEFREKYSEKELVLKKFDIIKNLTKEVGFKFPD